MTVNGINVFQFHNGSIKTKQQVKSLRDELSFQFHNGSIKTQTKANQRMFLLHVSIP